MSNNNKDASDLSYDELKALLEKKKQERLTTLNAEIAELKTNLSSKQAELAELSGVSVITTEAPRRRGRPAGSGKNNSKGPTATKGGGKRGAVGEAIRAFVLSKGKAGAKVKEIAQATGYKPTNVTAFFYTKANKKAFKKVAPATFASIGK